MNAMTNELDSQLEMSFDRVTRCRTVRRRRLSRAQWWFERMRQVVDCAIDWEPKSLPRPEQIWFSEPAVQGAPSLRNG